MTFWYYSWWTIASFWQNTETEGRPTENAAFRNLYSESLYAGNLRWLMQHGG